VIAPIVVAILRLTPGYQQRRKSRTSSVAGTGFQRITT